MRSMKFVLAGLTAAAALLVTGVASAGPGDAATGGGQTLVGTKGAGNTIAFTAKGTIDAGDGQVQFVDRSAGKGPDQVVHHGTVSCLDVMDNVAKIAGTWNDGGTFGIYVEDNGQGSGADDDVVTMVDADACDFDDPEDDAKTSLARGNVQVRDR